MVGGYKMKRGFDLIVSSCLSIIFLLPALVIACLVKSKLGSPVLFFQVRPGFKGKPFLMIKFRTMTDIKGADGRLLPDSERLTSLGLFLRASSLDELPELLNVLKGEMSLVGPRPLLMKYIERYTPEQARRHDIRPGITGWAQVNGRNSLSWEQKFYLDLWYVDNQSFLLDLRILFMTVWKVFRKDGINSDNSATMPEFLGSNEENNL